MFTCTANDGIDTIYWLGLATATIRRGDSPITADSYTITVTPSGSPVVSNATIESVSVELNGTTISCSSDGASSYDTLTVNITGNY